MQYLRCRSVVSPLDVEALIKKYILPVRNGRKDPRKVKTKSSVSFIYSSIKIVINIIFFCREPLCFICMSQNNNM